jgi:hypothetical protein
MKRIFSMVSRSSLPFLMAFGVGLFLAGTPLAAKMTPAQIPGGICQCYVFDLHCDICGSQPCVGGNCCPPGNGFCPEEQT